MVRAIFFVLFSNALLIAADVWITEGFDAFRKGEFSAGGFNLYVSHAGKVQTVHRWDVNNDGTYDLIFNNTHDLAYVVPTEQFSFARGSRNASAPVQYAGPGAVRVRIADLNKDGQPDLVIARGFDNSSRVQNSAIYWGSKNGWTEKYRTDLLTPYVTDACMGDLDGDGRADLVFTSQRESVVYWGRADGYYLGDRTNLNGIAGNSCLVADLDTDGQADLLLTGAKSQILWGVRTKRDLGARSPLTVDQPRHAIALGHDILFSTPKGPVIGRFEQKTFKQTQQLAFPGAGRLTAGDLNGDSVPDLVVTRASVGRNWATTSRVYWGQKTTASVQFSDAKTLDLPTSGAIEAAIADLDGDGSADLVFANQRDSLTFDIDSYIYWGAKDGLAADRKSLLPTHGAEGVAVTNGSIVFANSTRGRITGDIDTYVYLGGASGEFSPSRVLKLPTIGGYESCTADFNDDGFADLLLVGSHEGDLGSSIGSWIYWGDRTGPSAARRSDVPTRGAIGCATGDLNRDGYIDLVFSNMEDGTAQILWGSAQGYSKAREQNLPAPDPRFPSVADLNKDGYLDILVPSLKQGLLIFWGSAQGFSAERKTAIPSVGIVSQQIADLDRDGYLDIVMCNLMDVAKSVYRGVNSQILWGSKEGFSLQRKSELPSSGAHHATIADFNRDGYLDIFISNYQSEFTRSIDSHIYWGNAAGTFTAENRLALHNESAAGVVNGDFNNDGWTDLAVSNHVLNGDHHGLSLIFWNDRGSFSTARTTALPTIGPHMATGVDPGDQYTRRLEETYTSAVFDAGAVRKPSAIHWEGDKPFGSVIEIQLKSLDQRGAQWTTAEAAPAGRRWQFRAIFRPSRAAWPVLSRVTVQFATAPRN